MMSNFPASIEDYEELLWFGKIAWWVDRRKECNLIANYYIAEHLKFLCAEHHLKYDEACFLLPREMEEIASGFKTINDFPITERQKECTHLHDMYGNDEMLIREESHDLWEKVSHIEMTATNELKGMCGQKGHARGRVRVIMDAHNASDFNEGDILVTGMTRPDYLSLMKKAAAFITDEGGITCHAAIVARELKKPCVIGTKIATRVLQDGDLVEVDADNGIIKIIINAEDNLVNRFLSDIKGSVIFPPINGYSLYVYSSEFNSRKYIEPIWGLGMDKYDCLSISNGSEMSVYIAEEVFLELADRAFSKHLREPGYGQSLYDLMNSYVPAIKDLYRKCTYSFVDSHKEEEVIETFTLAMKAILSNKVRAFLTVLGIVIGVFSVIILVALVTGLQSYITNQISAFGSNLIFVIPGQTGAGRGPGGSTVNRLQFQDIEKLRRELKNKADVTTVTQKAASAKYSNKSSDNMTVSGVEDSYPKIVTSVKVDKGRFFNQAESDSGKKVAVIGPTAAKNLFGDANPLGKTISIGNAKYQVIGITTSRGSTFGIDQDVG
jgi:phosphohistidine swiveling domain-containing protein